MPDTLNNIAKQGENGSTMMPVIQGVGRAAIEIAAYMFEDDPDFRPDDVLHYRDIDPDRHPGVEDPYEGVIKYFGLDYKGDVSKKIAARTEILFTDIKSSLTLSFPIQQ